MKSPFVVILAGGSGQRLWPLSQKNAPKQLIQFLDGRSLLQHTLDRVTKLTTSNRIILVTSKDYAEVLQDHVGQLIGKILIEPVAKNTAPAILLALRYIHEIEPEAQVVILPADHFIPQELLFHKYWSLLRLSHTVKML